MNKKACVATIGLVAALTGCITSSLATADDVGEKWEKFKSYQPVPYAPMGFPIIDGIGKEFALQSDLFVKDVVQPLIEADKEGYIGVVAQFTEDVVAAKSSGNSENDVLQAWQDRYGAENITKLNEAFKLVRRLQDGKNAMAAAAVARLPAYIKLSESMPKAIDEIKAGVKDPFKAVKLTGTASQLGERIDALIWSANFVKILSEDQAAETEALKAYVDSFTSGVH